MSNYKLLQIFNVEYLKEICDFGKFIPFSLEIRHYLPKAN